MVVFLLYMMYLIDFKSSNYYRKCRHNARGGYGGCNNIKTRAMIELDVDINHLTTRKEGTEYGTNHTSYNST